MKLLAAPILAASLAFTVPPNVNPGGPVRGLTSVPSVERCHLHGLCRCCHRWWYWVTPHHRVHVRSHF